MVEFHASCLKICLIILLDASPRGSLQRRAGKHTHSVPCEHCAEETLNKTDIGHPTHTCYFKQSKLIEPWRHTYTPSNPFQMDAAVRLVAISTKNNSAFIAYACGYVCVCVHVRVCVCACVCESVCVSVHETDVSKHIIRTSLFILNTAKTAETFFSRWD